MHAVPIFSGNDSFVVVKNAQYQDHLDLFTSCTRCWNRKSDLSFITFTVNGAMACLILRWSYHADNSNYCLDRFSTSIVQFTRSCALCGFLRRLSNRANTFGCDRCFCSAGKYTSYIGFNGFVTVDVRALIFEFQLSLEKTAVKILRLSWVSTSLGCFPIMIRTDK